MNSKTPLQTFYYSNILLTSRHKQELNALTKACSHCEPLTMSFPSGQEDHICLLYMGTSKTEAVLTCAMSYYFPDASTCECVIFTHPAWRRRGMADFMLEELCRILEDLEAKQGPISLFFLTDQKSPQALSCLKALGAELFSSEYMMEWLCTSKHISDGRPELSEYSLTAKKAFSLEHTAGWEPASGRTCYYCCYQGRIIGSLQLDDHGSFLYLHHVEIEELLRGQGHGTAFLHLLLSSTDRPVRLQVSSENQPALRLYKKAGFQITEILSSYYY